MIPLPEGGFLLSAQQIPGSREAASFSKGQPMAGNGRACRFPPTSGGIEHERDRPGGLAGWRVIAVIRAEWFDTPKERLPPEANGNGTNRDGYGYFLYQATSSDGGKTWSKPAQLPIWGHPACLVQLRGGNLLMVYGHRRPPFSVRAILSHDRGQAGTWLPW